MLHVCDFSWFLWCSFSSELRQIVTWVDPGGPGAPFLVQVVGFLTLGLKLDPLLDPLFCFACSPIMDTPFKKSWIRPCCKQFFFNYPTSIHFLTIKNIYISYNMDYTLVVTLFKMEHQRLTTYVCSRPICVWQCISYTKYAKFRNRPLSNQPWIHPCSHLSVLNDLWMERVFLYPIVFENSCKSSAFLPMCNLIPFKGACSWWHIDTPVAWRRRLGRFGNPRQSFGNPRQKQDPLKDHRPHAFIFHG